MCVFFHASANDDIKEVIIILFQLDYKLVPKNEAFIKILRTINCALFTET